MAGTADHGKAFSRPSRKTRLLVIEARFHDGLADALLDGAKAALEEANASFDVVTVPGSLEIPAVISFALDGAAQGRRNMTAMSRSVASSGGDTYHFDIVANESSRALMDMSVDEAIAIGNGILTVENEEQAWTRARTLGRRQGRPSRRARADHDRASRSPRGASMSASEARPANKRGAARLAAVQALSTRWTSPVPGLLEIAAEYETFRLGKEVDGAVYREADAQWFRAILAGVVEDQTVIDPVIRQALQDDWRCRASIRPCAPSCAPGPTTDPQVRRAGRRHRLGICRYRQGLLTRRKSRSCVNAVLDGSRAGPWRGQGGATAHHDHTAQEARRTALILATASAIVGSAAPISISTGGLAGHYLLGLDKSLATAPVTAYNLGVALGALPLAAIVRMAGQRNGFLLGTLMTAFGGALACLGLLRGEFWLFAGGLMVVGFGGASVQQYRFAAADMAPGPLKAKAISTVLAGACRHGDHRPADRLLHPRCAGRR